MGSIKKKRRKKMSKHKYDKRMQEPRLKNKRGPRKVRFSKPGLLLWYNLNLAASEGV